jgi:hypothetical protein
VVFSHGKAKGGINNTDAALANAWVVTGNTIELVQHIAGDVVPNGFVNSNDALRIQGYFLTQGNPPFAKDPWSYWVKGETISANPNPVTNLTIEVLPGSGPITLDFWGMVSGDFNRSFTPSAAKTASESLTLNYRESIDLVSNMEFELPIYADMDMTVGAISLILDLPADEVTVQDVYLGTNPDETLDYTVMGDELRIAWFSMQPVYLAKEDVLLTLKLRTTNAFGHEHVYLSLVDDPLNELANDIYDVINPAVLTVDIMKVAGVGLHEYLAGNELAITCFPNPFIGTTNFAYSIPDEGRVTLEIFDVVGNRITTMVDEVQTSGEYVIELNQVHLPPGVYTATIKLDRNGKVNKRTIKIVSK